MLMVTVLCRALEEICLTSSRFNALEEAAKADYKEAGPGKLASLKVSRAFPFSLDCLRLLEEEVGGNCKVLDCWRYLAGRIS
jgi:hypothetical protein